MKNKKKRLLPLLAVAVFGVVTLSGCSTQESDAKWWNPLTWNWDALAFWKDKTPAVSEDVDPDGEGEEQNQEPQGRAKSLAVEINRAFGQDGKQTLTVTVNPSNADIDLSFSVDKAQVVVSKTGAKTAEVYVTTYFAGNATITVTDAVSGVTGTGKVYSYGKTALSSQANLAHGKTGSVVVSNTENKSTTAGVVSFAPTSSWLNDTLTSIFGEWGAPDSGYVNPSTTVYLHIGYEGSFAPVIWNRTNNQLYQVAGDTVKDPGTSVKTIAVTLVAGANELYIIGRPSPTVPTKPTQPENISNLLAGFVVKNATAAQGLNVPDITFTE